MVYIGLFICILLVVYKSNCSSIYGLIRHMSIDNDFDWTNEHGYQLNVTDCRQCLCQAMSNVRIRLFTCHDNNVSATIICQFYYFMPKRDALVYFVNHTSIYLMTNDTFIEPDDCCNTSYLVMKIKETFVESPFDTRALRFLVPGDNKTLVTVISNSNSNNRLLLKFDQATLKLVFTSTMGHFTSVGYNNDQYYLSTNSKDIHVYDRTLTLLRNKFSVGADVTTIRFVDDQQMLVGASAAGVIVYDRDVNNIFQSRTSDTSISTGQQLHGIAVVNQTAFYTAFYSIPNKLRLFKKNVVNKWIESFSDTINNNWATSDIVMDKCQRLWATEALNPIVHIYERNNKTHSYSFKINNKAFNMIILKDYTLVFTHEQTGAGLSRIRPSLHCRRGQS
jgi:hypothetical protein